VSSEPARPSLPQHLGLDRPVAAVLAELESALALAAREGLFQSGGLCQGYPLRPLPDRYFVARAFRADQDDLRGALTGALVGLGLQPVCGDDHLWPGAVLCKLAALIRGTPFGVYPLTAALDRNVCLELGIAIGLGRPFVLVKEPDAQPPALAAGLDYVSLDSYLELRHGLQARVRDFLVQAARAPAPVPVRGARPTAVVAHGGLDVLDFGVAAGQALGRCGLTPVFLDDPTGKLGEYLQREGISHEIVGTPGQDRLSATTEAIQTAQLGLYRVESAASPDAFVALGISLGLNRPGLLVRRAGRDVPADLKGLSTVDFSSFAALERSLPGCCAPFRPTGRGGQP
jgi:hypothetical protein